MHQFFMYGGNIISRRYLIFGAVLLAVAYLALVVLTKKLRYVQSAVLGLGMLSFVAININSYHSSIVQLRKQHDELLLDAYYWKNYTTLLTEGHSFGERPYWNHPTRMKELLAAVESAGLSRLYASNPLPSAEVLAASTQTKPAAYRGSFEAKVSYPTAESNLPEEYLSFYTKNEGGPAPAYFLMVSDDHVLPLPALPTPYSWEEFIKNKTYYSPQHQYGLYRSKLPAGQFQVWVMLPDTVGDKNRVLRYTRKIMRLL